MPWLLIRAMGPRLSNGGTTVYPVGRMDVYNGVKPPPLTCRDAGTSGR